MLNIHKFIIISLIANLFLLHMTFCGSAGIKNGNIRGLVLDNNRNGLPGVSVLLVKEGKPPIIRTTISNSKGEYYFNSTPIGKYSLGYSKLGFKSILVNKTNTDIETAFGNQVKTYVESGSSVRVPAITLRSLGAFGLAPVALKLIDQITGEPVNKANVSLGGQVGKNSQANGEFKLKITIPPTNKNLKPFNLKISAPGFESLNDELSIVPQQKNSFIISLDPITATIEGQIDFSAFPFANLDSITSISVPNIPSDLLDPKIDSTGWFSVKVPVSTENNIRKFNINIKTRGFEAIKVPNVIAPMAGAYTIIQPIRIVAVTTPVTGKVISNRGSIPIPSGINQAFIKELGLTTSINAGTYLFQAIPIGINLTVEIIIMNNFGGIEKGSLDFLTTINSQGNFTLPTVVTQPIKSIDNKQP